MSKANFEPRTFANLSFTKPYITSLVNSYYQNNSMRLQRMRERTRPDAFLKGVTELSVLKVRDVLESLNEAGKGSGEL